MLYDNCPNDEAKEQFIIPAWLNKMVENNWLGDKTGQGFFKKTKGAGGEKEILTLNLANTGIWAKAKTKICNIRSCQTN